MRREKFEFIQGDSVRANASSITAGFRLLSSIGRHLCIQRIGFCDPEINNTREQYFRTLTVLRIMLKYHSDEFHDSLRQRPVFVFCCQVSFSFFFQNFFRIVSIYNLYILRKIWNKRRTNYSILFTTCILNYSPLIL